MVGPVTSTRDEILTARREFAAMAAGWRACAAASAPRAVATAEVQVFNQMVVALERRFTPPEAIPGGREVQLLAQGIRTGGLFPSAPQWRAEASVSGYRAGDRIAMTEEVFSRLADLYLGGLTRRCAEVV